MAEDPNSIPVEAARRIAERVLADLKLAGEEARVTKLTEILMLLAGGGLDERAPRGAAPSNVAGDAP
ncbi:MAG: hypothetical protein ACREFS_00755 [Acetobacteraceae bacterium]